MSILDKAMFWKKDDFSDLKLDDSSFGANMGLPNDPASSMSPSYADPTPAPTGMPDMSSPSTSAPSMSSFHEPAPRPAMDSSHEPSYPTHQEYSKVDDTYLINKNIEIISSKLDALRASMDSMNQRLANIERLAYGDDNKRNRW